MKEMKRLKYVPGVLFAVTIAATAINGCAAAKDAAAGCDGLDVHSSAQVTVKSFSVAAIELENAAAAVEAKFLAVCNDMNKDLGIEAKPTAKDACAALKARIDTAVQGGVTVQANIEFNCRADVTAQAKCQGECNASASCDVKAKCEPGNWSLLATAVATRNAM